MAANAPLQVDILKLKLTTSATNMLQVGCLRICLSKNSVLINHTISSKTELSIVKHNQQEAYKEIIMRYSKLSLLIPYALLLNACMTVTPVYKDNDTRSGSCIESEPNSVTQQFYDYRIQHRNNDITALRPHLSDDLVKLLIGAGRDNAHRDLLNSDPFSSHTMLPSSTSVAGASTIPNNDVHNISLRVKLKQGDQGWHNEVLITHEGRCWVANGIHYLGGNIHVPAGTLHQSVENR